MAKHIYRATTSMEGVYVGDLFEADEEDPRVLSGRVEQVKAADEPSEVRHALADASDGSKAADAPPKPQNGS